MLQRGIHFLILLAASIPLLGATNVEPAKLEVSGYGFFGNRELKAVILSLLGSNAKPSTFDPTFVEDAVLVLFSRLGRDGYQRPAIKAKLTAADGTMHEHSWTEPLGDPLPRPLDIQQVTFEISKGTLFYFEKITFEGLTDIPLDEAAHFFIETDALIKLKRNRVYSPERLRSGLKNLAEALERKGFQSAAVTSTNLVIQTNVGAVSVDIKVTEGLRSYVRTIAVEAGEGVTNLLAMPPVLRTNLIFSQLWLQDFIQQLRREYYRHGYADVRIETSQAKRESVTNTVQIDLAARIFPENPVRVSNVMVEGEQQTSEKMLRERVDLRPGDLLDPIKAERGRYRLARLGIFETVDLRYDAREEGTRDVIYTVEEGKRIDFSILAGYGSYEMLRGGFEIEQYNLWGLAHRSRLRAIQSFKASTADYTYTIPQVFGREFDIFANASGLRREEIDFTREEFGGGAGVSRRFAGISSDVSARYNYQVLNASGFDVPPTEGLQSATVGSFVFDLRHDMRDNPLTPRSGYKIFSNFEVASEALFGEVNYQRFEASGAYHHQLGNSQWLHIGLSHGFVTTDNGPSVDLPFNKRFFPGGDNSIRGYQFGEAAPRDERGKIVGAESYGLANLEFEQGLTRSLSLVFFGDALGNARRIGNYPFDESLFSIGGGIRWKTLIGPARLEYGYNLNPRDRDPSGTLHFSIGFPF